MSTSTTPNLSVLREVLPRLLGTPGALPEDWDVQATTYDLTRFHSEATFAERFYAVAERLLAERIEAPDRVQDLLASCGLPYDYARLGQPLSTLYEMLVEAESGASHVVSFASRTKPYLSVIDAAARPVRLFAEGTLPLSEERKASLRARGTELHEGHRGPIPPRPRAAPEGALTVVVAEGPYRPELMAVDADAVCFSVFEGGVLLVRSSHIDVGAIRVLRKRTAGSLLASSALVELRRAVGLAAPHLPSATPAECDALLRGLFPEVRDALYFCTGLAAEAAVFEAVAEEVGAVTLFYAQNGYGGTGQLLGDLLPRTSAVPIRPAPLPVLDRDAEGRTVTLIERVVGALPSLGGGAACLFLEMPTNPELQLHDFDTLMAALRAYREQHGVTIPVLVDTTLAPLYPLLSQPFAQGWPFLCVKSGSKYFTRGKATLGVAFSSDEPMARSIMRRARAYGEDMDTLARPAQLAAALGGLSGLRPRLARIAEKTRELARRIEGAITARGKSVTLYHVSEEGMAQGLATGLLSFYLPPAPTTAPDLVDEFVDYLLTNAPTLVKNRVSYGQYAGEHRPDYVYVINPQESTQGSLSAATKAAQKKDNVQICRISVSEGADLDALVSAMERFFDQKYGPAR
ncbi:MAG TPA: PLP-dependent transferase [Polyangiaceae bacterium]|nr:PLP-dependent transferase [Polyangiaceae bacterium]